MQLEPGGRERERVRERREKEGEGGREGAEGRGGERTHSHKVGVFGIPHGHQGMDLFDQLLLFVVIKVHVPLG